MPGEDRFDADGANFDLDEQGRQRGARDARVVDIRRRGADGSGGLSLPPSGLHLPPGYQRPPDIDPNQHGPLISDDPRTDSLANIHDSEIMQIEELWNQIYAKHSEHEVDLEDFRVECEARFAEIGFKITVQLWQHDTEGWWMPILQLDRRLEAVEFDHDQKVREVTSDILGLGTEGVIKGAPTSPL